LDDLHVIETPVNGIDLRGEVAFHAAHVHFEVVQILFHPIHSGFHPIHSLFNPIYPNNDFSARCLDVFEDRRQCYAGAFPDHGRAS
jgi:hypothetical protein